MLELLKETKTVSQLASEYGVHVTVLRDWKQAAIKGLATVFEGRDTWTDTKASYERQIEDLYAEIGRLTTQITYLKKVAVLSHSERRTLIKRGEHALPIATQAELLSISHRSLYTQPTPPSPEEVAIKQVVYRSSVLWLSEAHSAAFRAVWANQSQTRSTLHV